MKNFKIFNEDVATYIYNNHSSIINPYWAEYIKDMDEEVFWWFMSSVKK